MSSNYHVVHPVRCIVFLCYVIGTVCGQNCVSGEYEALYPYAVVSRTINCMCFLRENGNVYCSGAQAIADYTGGDAIMFSMSTIGTLSGCIVNTARIVKCWGYNLQKQTGNSNTGYTGLTTVSGATDAVDLQCGVGVCCILQSTGVTKCWGYNVYGSLARGHTTNDHVARNCLWGTGVYASKLAVSGFCVCILTTTGSVKCSGYPYCNGYQGPSTCNKATSCGDNLGNVNLGNGGAVSNLFTLGDAAGGFCVVFTSGRAQCWGSQYQGNLGDTIISGNRGDAANEMGNYIPYLDPGGDPNDGIVEIYKQHGVAGGCALLSSQGVVCWGLVTTPDVRSDTSAKNIPVAFFDKYIIALFPIAGQSVMIFGSDRTITQDGVDIDSSYTSPASYRQPPCLSCEESLFCPGDDARYPCSTCVAPSQTATPCSATTDTFCFFCVSTSDCTEGDTFLDGVCIPEELISPVCSPCSVCDTEAGKYLISVCTLDDNTQCGDCVECLIGEYQSALCEGMNAGMCSVCPLTKYCPGMSLSLLNPKDYKLIFIIIYRISHQILAFLLFI